MDNSNALPDRFEAASEPTDGLITITDKKTGRETKVGLTFYASFVQSLNELIDFSEIETPSSETVATAPAAADEEVLVVEATKPKRGRPKKVVKSAPDEPAQSPEATDAAQAETPAEEQPSQEPTKPKRGRKKRAAEQELPLEPAAQPSEEAPKPKRGRPKKSDAAPETSAEPAETAQVEEAAPEKVAEPAAKPKRGRPKKSAAKTSSAKATEEAKVVEEAPKSKRVRPQKAVPKKEAAPATAVSTPSIEGKGYVLVPRSDDKMPVYDIIATSGANLGTVQQKADKRYYVEPADQEKFDPTDHTSLIAAKTRVFVIAR
ncbi:hypothetical protein AYJ57_21575 (plasmid) [Salipiger sp. CCB-MM3]|uniref:hypothetical protein n=1 Tax=Salipiger sp. CCB-MM3 TaxID=1792508 RepID=UPI00080A9AD9|nr:hypothetical protein [Salipiger sp. CCB-MM3]ANT63064.1 hypothetical protein AYJ57_21575 [Salipiger sp. CCB-MM3]